MEKALLTLRQCTTSSCAIMKDLITHYIKLPAISGLLIAQQDNAEFSPPMVWSLLVKRIAEVPDTLCT